MFRGFVIVFGLLAALPARAGELAPEQARRLVVGKLFSYSCFEGTRGVGRVNADGSVAGSIQLQGAGPIRYAHLPPGTLRVKGSSICASVRGMPIEPCFSVYQTDYNSFRGAVSGLGFAYCDFTRRNARAVVTSGAQQKRTKPLPLKPSLAHNQ